MLLFDKPHSLTHIQMYILISFISCSKVKRHSHAVTALWETIQLTKYIFRKYPSALKYLFSTVNANHDYECLCEINLEADGRDTSVLHPLLWTRWICLTFRSWQIDMRVKTCPACQERGTIRAKKTLHPKPPRNQ